MTSSHNRRQNVIREDNNRIDYVSPDAPYEYTNAFGVNSVIGARRDRPYITVFVNNTPLRMLANSGSFANIIDRRTLSQIIPPPRLQPTGDVRMFGFNTNIPLPILGQISVIVRSPKNVAETAFFVIDGNANHC